MYCSMSVCVFINGISSFISQPPYLGFLHWERVISVVTAIAVLAFCDCKWCEKRVKFECLKYSLKTKESTHVPKMLATAKTSEQAYASSRYPWPTCVPVSLEIHFNMLAWYIKALMFQHVVIACIFLSTKKRSLAVALVLLLRSFVSLWIVVRCMGSYTKCVNILWFAYYIEFRTMKCLRLIPCELIVIRTTYQLLNHPDGQALRRVSIRLRNNEDKELSKITGKRAVIHCMDFNICGTKLLYFSWMNSHPQKFSTLKFRPGMGMCNEWCHNLQKWSPLM